MKIVDFWICVRVVGCGRVIVRLRMGVCLRSEVERQIVKRE